MSLGLHAALGLMGLAVVGGRPGMAARADAGDSGDMTVTLVDPASLALPSAVAPGGLQALIAKVDTGAPPVTVSDQKGDDLNRLMQALSTTPATADDRRVQAAQAADAELDRRTAEADQHAKGAGTGTSGGGGLWGLVAPCWKSLAQTSASPVTLEVALNGRGEVSTPPRILRPTGAVVDERQLQAEARALTALSTCMTRSDPRFGGQVYRLVFRPDPPRGR